MPDHDEFAKPLAGMLRRDADEIEWVLSAHVDWKRRLRDDVVRGYCEVGSDDAGRDDLCMLGRWLSELPTELDAHPSYEYLVDLHARFHRAAASVVQLLEEGRIDDARAAMDPDSDFARVSEELVGQLEAWREAA